MSYNNGGGYNRYSGGGGSGYRNDSGGGGGAYRGNRRNYDTAPQKSAEELKQEEITSLVFRLGDTVDHFKTAVETAASQLIADYDIYPQLVKRALVACLPQMPHKAAIYAVLAGVVNAQSSEIGALLIEVTHVQIETGLKVNDFRAVKIMLRYLAELVTVGMVRPSALMTVYSLMLSVISEPGVRVERSDAFVYALLASVPWSAATLNVLAPEEFLQMMQTVETYMNARRVNFSTTDIPRAMRALATYRDVPEAWPFEQLDRLETLWRQILDMKDTDEWTARILHRPADFEEQLATQAQHELKPLKLVYGEDEVKFSYQPVFWMFDDSLQTPDNAIIRLPPTRTISRFILQDLVSDIIRIFSLNHSEACRILFALNNHLDTTFLETEEIKTLACVVESLFSEMLRLPRSGERGMYYATVLMDMIKEDIKEVPRMIGRAVRTLYSRLDGPLDLGGGMDIEAVRRLTEWFAVHLSNFGFVWNWANWGPVLHVERASTSFVFVRETLERSTRLAYWERVQGTIPENFADCADIFPPQAPKTNFKFENTEYGSPELQVLVTDLRKSLAAKAPPPEVSGIIAQIKALPPAPMAMDDVVAPLTAQETAREAFVQCVMLQGSKSFSHVLNVVERYIGVLREQSSVDDAARAHTVRVVAEFWRHNTQFLEIILDKLINYRVIDPKSVISWVLDPVVLADNYTRFYLWAVLRTTLGKVNFKVAQLTKKVEDKKAERTLGDPMLADGDELAQLDDARAAALREQKEVFLLVFQLFTNAVAATVTAAPGSPSAEPAYARWVLGNMREVARGFPNEVRAVRHTLDNIIFIPGADARCIDMWADVKAVYDIHTFTTDGLF